MNFKSGDDAHAVEPPATTLQGAASDTTSVIYPWRL